MSFDLAASLRRLKPEKKTDPLRRRGDDALPFVADGATVGPPLLLDTTVYIDTLQDRLPEEVADLLRLRRIDHSSFGVAELAFAFGRLDPSHAGTPDALRSLHEAIDAIPDHRLAAPSVQAVVEAGLLSGTVARLRRLRDDGRQPLFNDAVLLLQAYEQGGTLLSRNIADLDVLLQLFPEGRVLFYRRTP